MIKRVFLALIIAISFYACDQAGRSRNTENLLSPEMINNPAAITFDSTKHNFGKIPEGEKVTCEFKFTNTSKNPLVITEVHASCGCTTPYWPKDIIKPGESNVIKVEYDSDGHPGKFKKGITVTTNTTPNRTVLNIEGEVI